MDDFMDYLGYKIFIGEGKEFGFGDDDEEEEEPEQETVKQETKSKSYDRNYSGKNSREF